METSKLPSKLHLLAAASAGSLVGRELFLHAGSLLHLLGVEGHAAERAERGGHLEAGLQALPAKPGGTDSSVHGPAQQEKWDPKTPLLGTSVRPRLQGSQETQGLASLLGELDRTGSLGEGARRPGRRSVVTASSSPQPAHPAHATHSGGWMLLSLCRGHEGDKAILSLVPAPQHQPLAPDKLEVRGKQTTLGQQAKPQPPRETIVHGRDTRSH